MLVASDEGIGLRRQETGKIMSGRLVIWLKKAVRRGARLLLRGAQRYAPRLHGWCASWLYDLYFARRYAKEYRHRTFAYEPLLSIIIPVYNPPQQYLVKLIESIQRQKYTRWELCIADDASTLSDVRPYLTQLQAEEPRAKIVFLSENQHISRATNAAMRVATGDYCLFMDNDDVLFTPWALTAFVDALQDDRADMLYADNVMIDHRGAVQSFAAKPDWEVDFLFSTCYITHPLMVARELVEKLEGFRPEFSGAQDIDLINRATLLSPRVKHIAKYLYGWRMLPGSVTTSTDAKPTIIPRSLRSHNELLEKRQSAAVATWPPFFEKRRIGAYKLQFPNVDRSVASLALIVVGNGSNVEPPSLDRLLQIVRHPISDILMLTKDRRLAAVQRPGEKTLHLAQGESLAEALSRVASEYVLFLDSTIDLAYTSAIDELLGYLLLDPQIGVVAGKVMDHEHHICCSSYAFLEDLRLLGEGRRDADFDGYWFKNRLAHNTLAVPDRFCATKTRLLVEYGFDSDQYGAYAMPDLCLRLRSKAIRTVYNPWAVCLSPELRVPPPAGSDYEAFKRKYFDLFNKDPYYLRCA